MNVGPSDSRQTQDENATPQPLSYAAKGNTPTDHRRSGAPKVFFGLGLLILAIAAMPLCASLLTEYSADRIPLARLAAALAVPGAMAIGAGLISIRMRRANGHRVPDEFNGSSQS
jgi:hypothetical protein